MLEEQSIVCNVMAALIQKIEDEIDKDKVAVSCMSRIVELNRSFNVPKKSEPEMDCFR
jgi:hypothetical protein